MAILYFFLSWESSKWKLPIKFGFSWFKLIISFLVSSILVGSLLFLFFSHNVTRLDIKRTEKKLIVHWVVFSKEIPFSEIKQIQLSSKIVTSGRTSSSKHTEFFITDGKNTLFDFSGGKWAWDNSTEFDDFKIYTNKLSTAIMQIIEASK